MTCPRRDQGTPPNLQCVKVVRSCQVLTLCIGGERRVLELGGRIWCTEESLPIPMDENPIDRRDPGQIHQRGLATGQAVAIATQ